MIFEVRFHSQNYTDTKSLIRSTKHDSLRRKIGTASFDGFGCFPCPVLSILSMICVTKNELLVCFVLKGIVAVVALYRPLKTQIVLGFWTGTAL